MKNDDVDYRLLGLGVILIMIPLFFAVAFTDKFEMVQFYMRLIASLGGALVGACLPGLLHINFPGVKAGGALAILALFWLVNPPKIANDVATGRIEGDPKVMQLTTVPDLEKTKRYEAKQIDDFAVSGHAHLEPTENNLPGYFDVVARSFDNRDNMAIEFRKEIQPHYYLSARLSGDPDIGTLEMQGLGPENKKIHFIVDNAKNKYYLWAGEENVNGWNPLPHPKNDGSNTLGLYQYGRYVVCFLNNERVASFDTLSAQIPGRVGIAFKRQRVDHKSWALTDEGKDALAKFDAFTVYEF